MSPAIQYKTVAGGWWHDGWLAGCGYLPPTNEQTASLCVPTSVPEMYANKLE